MALFGRISPLIWLSLAVGSGMVFMGLGGAPSAYLIGNGVALLLAVLIAKMPLPQITERRATWGAILLAALLVLPLLTGPEVEGVRRWIPLGPVKLNAGMLVLSSLLILLPSAKLAAVIVALVALGFTIMMQPDCAIWLAMTLGFARAMMRNRDRFQWIVLVSFVLLSLFGVIRSTGPAPVPFVEGVFAQSFATMPVMGVVMALAMLALLAGLWARGRHYWPIAGTLAGFTLASLLAPFPTPLLGYGAAPILGIGLALALVGAFHRNPIN